MGPKNLFGNRYIQQFNLTKQCTKISITTLEIEIESNQS